MNAACLQVAADSKFVDLGADSLDTVSSAACVHLANAGASARRESPPAACCMLSQVEIMMALEEKFDITLDEEGGCCVIHAAARVLCNLLL
jgi:hypothetical protein